MPFNGTWSCVDGFSIYAEHDPTAGTNITLDRTGIPNCKVLSTNADAVFGGLNNNTLSLTFSF